jgi:hypothetical protein
MKSSAERATDAVVSYLGGALKIWTTRERETLARGMVRSLLRANIRLEYVGQRRTTTQNNFLHLLFRWLAFRMDNTDADLVKEGIKEKYGPKTDSPFGGLLPKPTHLLDKIEEVTLLVEGCFLEAAERGIDVEAFIAE